MSTKRSIGVTVFAWLAILNGSFSFLGIFSQRSTAYSTFLDDPIFKAHFVAGMIANVLSIIIGINLLKLKGWARKGIIALSVYVAVSMACFTPWLLSKKSMEKSTVQWNQSMKQVFQETSRDVDAGRMDASKQLTPEQEKLLMNMIAVEMEKKTPTFIAGVYTSTTVMIVLFSGLVIFYFTRPKVKEQFEDSRVL